MVQLKEHQIKPVEFIKDNHGLILYHSTGSGKTITSLVSTYNLNKDIVIIGPKSSRKAFSDEIERLNYDLARFTIYSFAKIKSILKINETIFQNKCVIVDEAHHMRSPTKRNISLHRALKHSYRVILLTATPIINYLSDISVLVNIAKNADVLPVDKKLFNFLYFDEEKLEITNEKQLATKLEQCISFYDIDTTYTDDNTNNNNNALAHYPKSDTVYLTVEMNNEQIEEYKIYIRKIIYEGKEGVVIKDVAIDFEEIDLRKKNAFLSATRQLSNTVNGDTETPKMNAVFNKVIKGPFPVIIYSNYLKNGVFPMVKKLNAVNKSYQLITGNTSIDEVRNIVNDYNSGKIQVLLLSSAGSESLDLKNTRQIHIMEPHWNEAKIRQVVGRAIRYQSHESLKSQDRHVVIYRWISIFGDPYKNLSADEYLTQISKRKDRVYNAFKRVIIDSSIENIGKKPHKGGQYYCRYIRYLNRYEKYK